jgi:AIPR protein
MPAQEVREAVSDFREKHAYGDEPQDCFAPWYLKTTFGLAPTEAIRMSAESLQGNNGPGFDFGIDGFCLTTEGNYPILTLVQAKYSNDTRYIAKGVRDFEKSIAWLKRALYQEESDFPQENKVLRNLWTELKKLPEEEKKKLKLHFVVIHLSEEDDAILNNRTKDAQEELIDLVRTSLPDHPSKVWLEGPRAIEKTPPPENAPIPAHTIDFDGIVVGAGAGKSATMYLGVGRLSQLVEIYKSRRDDLFSKNVRSFLDTARNREKGPSGKMKLTLKAMCITEKAEGPPENFALYHNGITIFARNVSKKDNTLVLREPYVLNGCQTIKTAYFFSEDSQTHSSIKSELWERVKVPIRVVESQDDYLIRQITVNTNRQNAITAAALRANDPKQIELQDRFARRQIFYERQEGAYDSLENSNSPQLTKEFRNSEDGAVYIDDIAPAIAAAAGELSRMQHVNDIFESDKAYDECFSQKALSSIVFLTFLQNITNVLTLVLKKDLDLDWNASQVKPNRISRHVLCLLVRYLAKKRRNDVIIEFGQRLWARDKQWRDEVKQHLDNYHSGIKREVEDKFMPIENPNSEKINSAFRRMESSLRLSDQIDVFAVFGSLDAEVDSTET